MAGGRGGYYDTSGALRDMVQNHMMQLLCLVAMEPPVDLSADAVRNEKVKVLAAPCRAGRPRTSPATSSGASTPPARSRGRRSPATSRRRGSGPTRRPRPTSRMRLTLNNWRWAGVPFYLRTGKRLPKRATEIAIQFRRPPTTLFEVDAEEARRGQPAGPADPAERGGEPRLPGQDPRLAAAAPGGPDGLPLRHRLRRPAARGLRAAAARRDARRPDPVHPHRRGRERLAVHHRRSSTPGTRPTPRPPSPTSPAPGAPRPPTPCSPATGSCRRKRLVSRSRYGRDAGTRATTASRSALAGTRLTLAGRGARPSRLRRRAARDGRLMTSTRRRARNGAGAPQHR